MLRRILSVMLVMTGVLPSGVVFAGDYTVSYAFDTLGATKLPPVKPVRSTRLELRESAGMRILQRKPAQGRSDENVCPSAFEPT